MSTDTMRERLAVILPAHEAWEHRKNIPAAVRQAVLDRDNAQCQLCGTSGDGKLQLHHWYSFRSHGGAHVPENLVTLCFRCHGDVHEGRQDVLLVEIDPGVWRAFPGAPSARPGDRRRLPREHQTP